LSFLFDSFEIDEDLPDRFHSFYVQDTWRLSPTLTMEAALHYDDIEYNDFFQATVWNRAEIDPRLGLIWKPVSTDTFRLAAFRYVLPHWSARLDPTDVAGVTIFRNSQEGTLTSEVDLIWEHEWSRGFLLANLFYLEREHTFLETAYFRNGTITNRANMRGVEAIYNQLFSPGLGLALNYRYLDVEDENFPRADRKDHLARARLNFVHPSGFRTGIDQTYRFADLVNEERPDEPIWLTDVSVGYELPGKRGSLDFVALNLFNRRFNWVVDQWVYRGRIPARRIMVWASINF
jgi:outer membrane receptor protein involved in Fe transport